MIDNLTTNDPDKALSANQGVVLLDKINKKTNVATIQQYNNGSTSLSTPAVSWASLLGQDYTYESINSNGLPLTIKYSDGVECNIVYRSDNQIDYYTIQGYKVTYLYDVDDFFIGKKTTTI